MAQHPCVQAVAEPDHVFDNAPSGHVWVLVEGFTGPSNEYLALTGSVTVSSAGPSSVEGTFTADFGADGALTGSFDALLCAD